MSSLEEIRATRLAKADLLKSKGINPYPVSTGRDVTLADAVQNFEELSTKKELCLAGRIMALRGQGGLVFADLFDGTGTFQALLKKDDLGDGSFTDWGELIDIGDFVEVSGFLFLTKRSEKTLQVKKWRMLTKSLRPLPEKWHGLTDTEERFRRRYLDTLMNDEVRARFVLRSRIISALRASLDGAGFLEVETSMLQSLAGGANAEPFTTHHNALDINLYLRIAPELDLKKLLIGGYPKIYEVGRSFRNEGIDVTHNPEFTTIEWYEAYSDAAKQRIFIEKTLRALVEKVKGVTTVIFDGTSIDFQKPFAVMTYAEALARYALIVDPEKATKNELSLKAKELGVSVGVHDSPQKILDGIFKKVVRPKLLQPTYIISYPKEMIPLAKEDAEKENIVDAFQCYAGGLELIKAFSELNDPIEQACRFKDEEGSRKVGDREAQPNDKDFIEALEYGMPPAGGVGIGIERLVMLLSDVKNIREAIFFPTLRPKTGE